MPRSNAFNILKNHTSYPLQSVFLHHHLLDKYLSLSQKSEWAEIDWQEICAHSKPQIQSTFRIVVASYGLRYTFVSLLNRGHCSVLTQFLVRLLTLYNIDRYSQMKGPSACLNVPRHLKIKNLSFKNNPISFSTITPRTHRKETRPSSPRNQPHFSSELWACGWAGPLGICYRWSGVCDYNKQLEMQQGVQQGQVGSKKCRKIGPYILLRAIGKGSYSTVFEARMASGGRFAVKQISLQNLTAKQLERIQQEVAVLSVIKHENIVALLDFKQTARNLYLVFEHCQHTDLQAYLAEHSEGTLPEARVRRVMLKLKAAFRVIRQHRVVHRDLKLSNILVTADFEIKLADFGFARAHAEDEYFRSVVGTPLTMAPEILDRREYNEKCDIWSLGVVTYQMLFGCSPFFRSDKLTHHEIRESFNRPLEFPRPVSQQAQDFMRKMLVKDPANRMGFQQFFEHEWLREEGVGSLSQLLRGQALRGELLRSLSGSNKPAAEQEFILGNCQSILGYCFIEFVKGYIENSLTGWANLARHVLDLHFPNRRLTFLALALLLENIDAALTAPYAVLVNAGRLVQLPKYMELRAVQSWEMSEYSKRLPNFIAKSRANIQDFLASDSATMSELKASGELPISQLLLREVRKEVQARQGQGEGAQLRVFLRVRPWGGRHVCVSVESSILTHSALELLLRTLSLDVRYDSLCKKCANVFRFAVVNELTALEVEMQQLREKMAHSQSIIF